MSRELEAIKAVKDSITLWEWCALTGKAKGDWPGWERNGGKYPRASSDCFLCKYTHPSSDEGCYVCPYQLKYGLCLDFGTPYFRWYAARSSGTKKKYAKQSLKQLKEVLKDLE